MADADLPDERLRPTFPCAHPAIEAGIRAPLILQTILGFDAAAIASAFLVSPATTGQRLVRAKSPRSPRRAFPSACPGAQISASASAQCWRRSMPPSPKALPTRMARRRATATSQTEGIWLGRLAAELMPDEPEALGLLALMLFAEARRAARRNARGDYALLAEQDVFFALGFCG